MVYLSLLTMLIVFSLSEGLLKNNSETRNIIFFATASIALTLIACFRFGQGLDYTAYMTMYDVIGNFSSISAMFNSSLHGEKGFLLLCYICSELGIPFELFVFGLSIVEMILLCRFIYTFSSHRMLSLLLAFHTLYLTYIFSALRQGLVICAFLGLLLPLLTENKIYKYIIGVLLCSLFHSSAFILLLPVFINRINFKNTQSAIIAVTFCFLLGGLSSQFINLFFSSLVDFTDRRMSIGISFFALLKRLGVGAFIIYLYRDIYSSENFDKRIKQLYKIYILGLILYGIFSGNSLVAARLSSYFECLEIILIPLAISRETNKKMVILSFCIVMVSSMYFKNINEYIENGGYYYFVNVFNYPYLNVFNENAFTDYCMAPLRDMQLIYQKGDSFF